MSHTGVKGVGRRRAASSSGGSGTSRASQAPGLESTRGGVYDPLRHGIPIRQASVSADSQDRRRLRHVRQPGHHRAAAHGRARARARHPLRARAAGGGGHLDGRRLRAGARWALRGARARLARARQRDGDRKSTRLNSSHSSISYAVFCLKKKKNKKQLLFFLIKKKKNKQK